MIDHLVYAVTDLKQEVAELATRLGVAPSPGGRHVGRGTANHLLSLGGGSYLEVIGPDPEATGHEGPRAFDLEALQCPQLRSWAVTVSDIETRVEAARAAGYDPGPVMAMSRERPDGVLLTWKLTASAPDTWPNLIPFLIAWGDTPHPSTTSAAGARLLEFRAETPEPQLLQAALDALQVSIPIVEAEQPALVARIAGPGGELVLT